MNQKFGNPEYMDRIMETFAKEASESLKKTMSSRINEKKEKEIDKVPQN